MSESEIKNDNKNINDIKIENEDKKLEIEIIDNSDLNSNNKNEIKNNNSDKLNCLNDLNDKNYLQKQKEFNKLLLNQKGNKNLSLDQKNLFETFVLFQNFINMNKMNKQDLNPIKKLNFEDNNIEKEENKKKINEKENENENESESPKQRKKINNYDEIPIKPSNFLELLEKTLANEKEEQNFNNTIPKKKVIKVNSDNKKKQILLSKPSKKEKKYSYYTDYLDEKGHFLEGKYNKNTHPKSGRNKSSNSNKKNSFSENKSFFSENLDLKINQKSLKIINENEENKKNNEKKIKEITEINEINENNENKIIKNNEEMNIEKKKLINKEHIIEKKIGELNNELIKYKEERAKIDRLKNEYEQLQYELNLDIEEFNSKKIEFEKFRESELKKIEKEKKNYNIIKIQNQQLINNAKKDKETIDFLRKQISKLQNELRHKEINNKHALIKMKKQIKESSSKKNLSTLDTNIYSKKTIENILNSGKTNSRTHSSFTNQKMKTKKKLSQDDALEHNKRNLLNELENTKKMLTKNKTNNVILSKVKSINEKSLTEKSSNLLKVRTKFTNKNIKKNININKSNPNIKIKNLNNTKTENDTISNFDISSINNEENFDFIIPEKYKDEYSEIIKTVTSEGKKINLFSNNKREVIFQSGVRKEIFTDGYQIVYFKNGDLKQTFPNGKNVYYFNSAKTVQTSFPNGIQVFKFNNNQIEKHFPDGQKQIFFPDGSFKYIFKNGFEETHFADGIIQKNDIDNTITLEFQDGTKEIKYPNGREERILCNGDVEVLNYSNSDFNSEDDNKNFDSQFGKENVIFENEEIIEEDFNK